MPLAPDEMVVELMQRLEIDHQYVETVPAYDDDRIDLVRTAGRVAGRRLGWKVRTFARDNQAGMTVVVVIVVESTDDDQERLDDRSRALMLARDV